MGKTFGNMPDEDVVEKELELVVSWLLDAEQCPTRCARPLQALMHQATTHQRCLGSGMQGCSPRRRQPHQAVMWGDAIRLAPA